MSREPRFNYDKALYNSDDPTGCNMMHVDMDAFFAGCEIARNPELKGKPVIVGNGNRSVVSAANYVAREYGVHSAMPVYKAKEACPNGIFLPVDMDEYVRVSNLVMEILHNTTPQVEQLGVDEAFVDVTGALKLFGTSVDIAQKIRREVEGELGVICSVGIAENKTVAKLASAQAKPDGFLLISKARTQEFVANLPITCIWGVGRQTQKVMDRHGIRRVSDLLPYTLESLVSMFGNALGIKLYQSIRGIDDRQIAQVAPPKSIGHELTMPENTPDLEVVQKTLMRLADRVASRVRAQNYTASCISLRVKLASFESFSLQEKLTSPTDVALEILTEAKKLLNKFHNSYIEDHSIQPVYRLIGISTSDFTRTDEEYIQGSLFDIIYPENKKRREVEHTVDQIRNKFKKSAIDIGA